MNIQEVYAILKKHNINILTLEEVQEGKTKRITLQNGIRILVFEDGEFRVSGKNKADIQKLLDEYKNLSKLGHIYFNFDNTVKKVVSDSKKVLQFGTISAIGGIIGNRADSKAVEALKSLFPTNENEHNNKDSFEVKFSTSVKFSDKDSFLITCVTENILNELNIKLLFLKEQKIIIDDSEILLTESINTKGIAINIDSSCMKELDLFFNNNFNNLLYFSGKILYVRNNIILNLIPITDIDYDWAVAVGGLSYAITGPPKNLITIIIQLTISSFEEAVLFDLSQHFFRALIVKLLIEKIKKNFKID